MIDFDAVAQAVIKERDARGLTLKEIAADANVNASKLTTLTKGTGGLSTDNLLKVCDWLGESIDYFRADGAPRWLQQRLQDTYGLTPDAAEAMAERRQAAARRQGKAHAELSTLQDLLLRDMPVPAK